jgi:alkylhydroperoxidase/carboxymuconolactone decarboxylase family protein YurZ
MPGSADLRTALNRADLRTLRQAWDAPAMGRAIAASLDGAYPPARPYVDAIAAAFYWAGTPTDPDGASAAPLLAPVTRELVLIGILGARGARSFDLAVHLYFALMEGASVDQVCATLELGGVYGGLPAFSDGLVVLGRTLSVLTTVAAGPAHDGGTVLKLLRATFPLG